MAVSLQRSNDIRLGRNLTHSLLAELGRAIVVGDFDDVGFPTEAALSQRYGVSRSVTREAVKMLTAKGLLRARPRQGTTIQSTADWNLFDTDVLSWTLERKFSIELLRYFTELRIGIEPAAAALAAANATEQDKRHIAAGLDRMKAAEQGWDDTLEADISFHVAILNASKNPFYNQFEDVVATALRTSIRFTNRIKGRSASIGEHVAVLDAIIAGDQAAASRAMTHLISEVLALIEQASVYMNDTQPTVSDARLGL